MKVLIVDDEPDILDQAEISPPKNIGGPEIGTENSVEKGLELLEEKH